VTLCACGCGQPTTIIDGVAKRTRRGHHRRLASAKRYRQARPNSSGETLAHRQRAEAAIGHPLPLGATVHHPDEDPWNPHARLVICPSHAYHFLLHVRTRVLRAGGNPNTDKICSACQQVLPKTAFGSKRPNPDGLNDACRPCTNARVLASKRRLKALRIAQPNRN
jgi:hypothetical protein